MAQCIIMIIVGPYPVESSFYPEHVAIPFMTLLIFVVLLYVISKIRARLIQDEKVKSNPEHKIVNIESSSFLSIKDFKSSEVISALTLIVTIVTALVVPFTQLPVLDYTVSGPLNKNEIGTEEFEIAIHNYGAKTAKDVTLSFKAEGAKFEGFSSLPFLDKHFTYNTHIEGVRTGEASVEITELPPHSYTVVRATVSQISDERRTELITYLRSEEAVAYHQTTNLILFYGILAFFYVFFTILFGTGISELVETTNHTTTTTKYTVNYHDIAVAAILIISGIVAASLVIYLPNVETQIRFYPLYYWAGTLIIPVTIAVLAVIFYQYTKPPPIMNRSKFRHIAEAAILAASCIVAANLLLSLNTDTHLLRFWAGILIIPITIVLLIVTYKDSSSFN
jgi:hypothetical protein